MGSHHEQLLRLSSACHILFEKEFIELNKKYKALELTLFWKDHSLPKLHEAMRQGNKLGPNCDCSICTTTIRYVGISRRTEYNHDCTFAPWFKSKMNECGLSFQVISNAQVEKVVEKTPMCTPEVHIIDSDDKNAWYNISYGSKLWKAASIEDPEILKLKALFEALEGI